MNQVKFVEDTLKNLKGYGLPKQTQFNATKHLPISCYWSHSIPPEYIGKALGFLMFSGGIERDQWYEMRYRLGKKYNFFKKR